MTVPASAIYFASPRTFRIGRGAIVAVIAALVFMALPVECALALGEDDAAYFRDRVVPILKRRCYSCHSHSAGEMGGNLSLDWRSGWEVGGEHGPALVPGDTSASLLVRAISHNDTSLKMPEQKLPSDEIDILIRWIERGAFDDRKIATSTDSVSASDWWSLRPLIRSKAPRLNEVYRSAESASVSIENVGSSESNWIDEYVRAGLDANGLEWSPRADRRTLLRRVCYDLIGLPPTWDQIVAFETDASDNAYEKAVDELLASPRYGERWSRHWLDTIHFADSHGYEHDIGRDHAWPFRDYVIDVFNSDKPWDQLIREQIAADFFYPDQPHLTPALGFLGAGTFDLSTYSTATVTFEYLDRDDLVTQTMAAFASTTANCARCHSHKFDPIPQEDYYALQSVFAGIVKGDIAYDADVSVAEERKRLERLSVSAKALDATVLFSETVKPIVDSWLIAQSTRPRWNSIQPISFLSMAGAVIEKQDDSIFVVSGSKPERDDYTITAPIAATSLRAIRLDVLSHATLPANGPGRAENGNLHLSEFEVMLFEPGVSSGRKLIFDSPSADFNQAGWGIERAIDGDAKTAWGIHPAVGQNHSAVFAFKEPLVIKPDSHIVVTIRQQHGGAHTIGSFRLSWTSDLGESVKVLPIVVERALAAHADDRTDNDRLAIAGHAVAEHVENALKALQPKQLVYAAGKSVSIPMGNGQSSNASVTKIKEVHVLHRGDFDKPRAAALPGALSACQTIPSRFDIALGADESERRAALALWLSHRDNPLTWRSVVNRVWHYHFGKGLCDTPSDFGKMGGIPSHPELIDALAVWFRDDAGMSLKKLHRLIVTSRTYCQSSESNQRASQIDQGNRWLWRQNRARQDADCIRDSIGAVSGELQLQMGGPGVQHFRQSPGPQSTPTLDYAQYDWGTPGSSRRSIYRYVWRGIADPFMESLDFPDLGLLSPVRGFSASSLQSLAMFNNDFVLFHSQRMAEMVERQSDDLQLRVVLCVQRCWQRNPSDDELALFMEHTKKNGLASLCRVLFNSNEFLFVD